MKTGIYKNINISEYHKDKLVISSSGLKMAKVSTRNFAYYAVHGTAETSHFDFGNAFEINIMDKINGTDYFSKEVAVLQTEAWVKEAILEKPDLKNPKASATYKRLKAEFEQNNFGKYIIKDKGDTESMEALTYMTNSCINNEVVRQLLTGTEYQISLIWKDKDTGLMCKTRPDICRTKKNVILDIKTTIDASPNGFARQVANFDYPLQAVMQCEGAIQTGLMQQVDKYFWLAVEKKPPYNFGLYEFQKDDIDSFLDMYNFYLARCAKAVKEILNMKNNDFTKIASYGENADNRHGILTLEIPLWYRN